MEVSGLGKICKNNLLILGCNSRLARALSSDTDMRLQYEKIFFLLSLLTEQIKKARGKSIGARPTC